MEPLLSPLPVHLATNCRAYRLQFTWCNREIAWQVLQDLSAPGSVPDIIVDDPSFQPLYATHSPEQLQQLRSLLSAAAELGSLSAPELFAAVLQLFAAHHAHRLHALGNPRLEFELSTLEGNPEVQYMLAGEGPDRKACFGVPLDGLSTECLARLREQAPGVARQLQGASPRGFVLHVAFKLQAGGAEVARVPDVALQLPAPLARLLPPLQLPSWSPESCLMEFALAATDRVQQQLDQAVGALQTKLSLLQHLQDALGRPLEVNLEAGTAAYYVSHDGHALLLLLELPPRFPEEKPQLSVQAARHAGSAESSFVVLRNCPWSPRWPPGEMGARLFNFVKDEVAAMMRKAGPQ